MDCNDNGNLIDVASIILAIDVGSSSVRCTAYQYSRKQNMIDTLPVEGCSSSIQRAGVEPISGIIQTDGLLEAVDSAVCVVLSKLRAEFYKERNFRVKAVGFSTFVMNLIAVDEHGELVPYRQNDEIHAEKGDNANLRPETISKSKKWNPHNSVSTSTISISYACNTPEAQAECKRLRRELGPTALDDLYQATGAPLHSAYAIPQLRLLYEGSKQLKQCKSHRWQSIAGYCLAHWTNRKVLPITYSEASWTGLLNVRDCIYEESAICLLPPDCRAALPELTDFTHYVLGIPQFVDDKKTIESPYWSKFPELRETKFFLGIGDGACANVGSKCTTSSRIAVTVGTSAAVRVCLRHEVSSSPFPFRIPGCQGLFCYRVDQNHVLIGGALTDGGSIVEWASRFLNLENDQSAFQKCLDETRALVESEYEEQTNQQRNLIMAPFLSGERSTGFREGAMGAVFGLTRETTSAHLFKSCLEGVSFRLKAVIDLLLIAIHRNRKDDRDNSDDSIVNSDNVKDKPVLVASGKAMEVNHLWRQMIADSCGLRVVLDKDTTEGTSRGVAQLIATSLSVEKNAVDSRARTSLTTSYDSTTCETQKQTSLALLQNEEELHPFITSEPRSIATAMYARKRRLQDDFIDAIAPIFSSS